MEEKFILVMSEGENEVRHIIGNVIRMEEKKFFSIFNMNTADLMFGEFLGDLPEEEDLAREVIWRDFMDGCKHITHPDGHILDDLFLMMDVDF